MLDPLNHNQETTKHGTSYPVVPRPAPIQFVSRFGEDEVKSIRLDVSPELAEANLLSESFPPKPADLDYDKQEFMNYKLARRAAARSHDWVELVTESVNPQILEVAYSGLVVENPQFKKIFEQQSIAAEDQLPFIESLKDDVDFLLRLAVEELLLNAVYYGNFDDPNKTLEVSSGYNQDGCFVMWVRDQGEGFNPNRMPDPTHIDNITDESGRGILSLLGKLLKDHELAIRCFNELAPAEWPLELDASKLGLLNLFDGGRGAQVKIAWAGIVK